MNPIATIRIHKSSWASTALSVFILAWLSMVVAPCLMAMDGPTDNMVEVSQSHHASDMDSHTIHDEDNHATSGHMDSASGSDHDCPRCPQGDNEQHCDVSDLNCSIIGDYDNRINQTKLNDNLQNNTLDDLEVPYFIHASSLPIVITPLVESSRCINPPGKPLSGGTPLNVLYCVYLI